MWKSGKVFYKHSGMCVFEPSLLREHAMGLLKLSEHFNQISTCQNMAMLPFELLCSIQINYKPGR
jgi:hypothetical protein